MTRWSPQQDAALRAVAEWMHDPSRQVFYLAGYAGTGKTTLAKHFGDGLDGSVLYGAFTGKAAYVLRQKGCDNATTIHSLIYISSEKSKAKLRELEEQLAEELQDILREYGPDFDTNECATVRVLKEAIANEEAAVRRPMFIKNMDSAVKDAQLLIIDECSMVDQIIGEDLLSFGTKILVLGDPGQLPPVFGTGFFTERQPDMTLTEIHRQAKDSPVLWMATRVREGHSIPLGKYGESSVVMKDDLDIAKVYAADQLLVGRNDTRRDSNIKMRKMRFFRNEKYNTYPVPNDRLVCLRNNHEIGLLNGAIWKVIEAGTPVDETIGLRLEPVDMPNLPAMFVTSHTHYFEKRGEALPWYTKKDAQEFDYGYAMTVHKSQGSQWDTTVLFDESWVFREYARRHLYTGLTRAAKATTLVRM